jgi:hypothetical protein
LTADLDGDETRDRRCLEALLAALVAELGMRKPQEAVSAAAECRRSPLLEVHLVMMRFLSVLMSRAKAPPPAPKSSSSSSAAAATSPSDAFVAQATATALVDARAVDFCLSLLQVIDFVFIKTTNAKILKYSNNYYKDKGINKIILWTRCFWCTGRLRKEANQHLAQVSSRLSQVRPRQTCHHFSSSSTSRDLAVMYLNRTHNF